MSKSHVLPYSTNETPWYNESMMLFWIFVQENETFVDSVIKLDTFASGMICPLLLYFNLSKK